MRSSGSSRRDGRSLPVLCALGVLIVGLLLTALGARAVGTSNRQQAEDRFRSSSAQSKASVEDQLGSYFRRIRNVGAFVASSHQPSTDDVRRFVEQDKTFEELPSLQSLIFIARVEDKNLDATVERVRAAHPDEMMDMQITHNDRVHYLVTDYVAGPTNFALPVGVDVSALESITAMVDRSAQDNSGIVASVKNDVLVIAAEKLPSAANMAALRAIDFFIGVPIFDGSGQYGFDHLIGWVAAPMAHFSEVLASAKRGRPSDLGQSLTVDVQAPGVDPDAMTQATAEFGSAASPADAAFTDEQTFAVMGVAFKLRTWSGADDSSGRATAAAALLGIITSLLAAAVVFVRMRAIQGGRAMLVELEGRREFEHAIVESVASAMVVLDHDGEVVMGNRPWTQLTADDQEELGGAVGPYLRKLAPASADLAGQLAAGLDEVLAGERDNVEMDVPLDRHGDRRWYSVRVTPLTGRDGGAVVMHTDITERHRSADDLQRRASRDGLTGVLNRTSLESRADDLVDEAARSGFSIGVLFIDLDDFKSVNDTYGHLVGDGVLRAAAAAIERTVRPGDSIGRIGGDEFVVLLSAGVNQHEVEAIASRLVFELSIPRTIEGIDIAIAASVGIALVDDPRTVDRAELIRRADEAMYVAKQSGGSQFAAAEA